MGQHGVSSSSSSKTNARSNTSIESNSGYEFFRNMLSTAKTMSQSVQQFLATNLEQRREQKSIERERIREIELPSERIEKREGFIKRQLKQLIFGEEGERIVSYPFRKYFQQPTPYVSRYTELKQRVAISKYEPEIDYESGFRVAEQFRRERAMQQHAESIAARTEQPKFIATTEAERTEAREEPIAESTVEKKSKRLFQQGRRAARKFRQETIANIQHGRKLQPRYNKSTREQIRTRKEAREAKERTSDGTSNYLSTGGSDFSKFEQQVRNNSINIGRTERKYKSQGQLVAANRSITLQEFQQGFRVTKENKQNYHISPRSYSRY